MKKFSKFLSIISLSIIVSLLTLSVSASESENYSEKAKYNSAVASISEKGFPTDNIVLLGENNGELHFKTTDSRGRTLEYKYSTLMEKEIITLIENGETDVIEYYKNGDVYVDGILNKTLTNNYNVSPLATYASSYSTVKSSLSTGVYNRVETRNGTVEFDNDITSLTAFVISEVVSNRMGMPEAKDAIRNFAEQMKSLAATYDPDARSMSYTQSIYKDANNYSGMYYFYRYNITYHYAASPSKAMILYRMDTLL